MNKYFLFILLLVSNQTLSQSDKEKIYSIYVSGKILEWKPYLRKPAYSSAQKLDQLKLNYAYIGWCIGSNLESDAKDALDNAENLLDIMLEANPKSADLYALRGAFYGYRIAMAPYKAMYYGRRSVEFINRAIELDTTSAQAWLEKANATYYAPEMFGGNKTEALQYYEKALQLMKKQNSKNNWLYINTIALTGKAYFDASNYIRARELFQLAIELEPDFHWVKRTLLPDLEKKLKPRL